MRRALPALALLLGLPLSVAACLWDRDTPADEARGMPEVLAVLTGRFARNPPLFYEMRLDRVTAHLRSHPEDLAAYDDAGVACDRLGRGDEAISWMEKKRGRLETLDPTRSEIRDQLYRYHANLGTFLVHRWVRQGANRKRIDEVKSARDEIAKALEVNPHAHFGREKYQFRALEWMIHPPAIVEDGLHHELPNLLGIDRSSIPTPEEADEAARGLAGLIVLGNAWESVDVFAALGVALQYDTVGFSRDKHGDGGRNSLAHLARLRCCELIDMGKGSMLPDAPEGDQLKSILFWPAFMRENDLESTYATHRAEADAWHAARIAFMTRRLKEGRHPDTDRDFWDGYTERPAPSLPTETAHSRAWRATSKKLALLAVVGVLAIGLIAGLVAIRSAKARRRKLPRPRMHGRWAPSRLS